MFLFTLISVFTNPEDILSFILSWILGQPMVTIFFVQALLFGGIPQYLITDNFWILVGGISTQIYHYILSCLIVWIYDKMKKRKR